MDLPLALSELVEEITEWSEDARLVTQCPIWLEAPLEEPRVRVALELLHLRGVQNSSTGFPKRTPIVLRIRGRNLSDPLNALSLATDLAALLLTLAGSAQAINTGDSASEGDQNSLLLRAVGDTAALASSLAGFSTIAVTLGVATASSSIVDFARKVRTTQATVEVPFVDERFLRTQLCALLAQIGHYHNLVLVVDGGSSGPGPDELIEMVLRSEAPVLFISDRELPSPSSALGERVELARLAPRVLSLRENEELADALSLSRQRRDWWGSLETVVGRVASQPIHPTARLIGYFLSRASTGITLSATEVEIMMSDRAASEPHSAFGLQDIGDGAFRFVLDLPDDVSEQFDRVLAGHLVTASTMTASLPSGALCRIGRVAADLLNRSTRSASQVVLKRCLLDMLEELWDRHRIELARSVLRSTESLRSDLGDLTQHQFTLLELVDSTDPQNAYRPDRQIQLFLTSARELATSSSSRAALLPVAESCESHLREVIDNLPAPMVAEVQLEIASVMAGSGESYRLIPLLEAWSDNGIQVQDEVAAQIRELAYSGLGTFAAFSERIERLTRRLTMVQETKYLALAQVGLLRDLGYMCWYIGRYEDASRFTKSAADAAASIYGSSHPESFKTRLSHAISLSNIGDAEGAAGETASAWSAASQLSGMDKTHWWLRLRRYATVEFVHPPVPRSEQITRRGAVLHDMYVALGPESREYMRCKYAQGHDRLAEGDAAGYSVIREVRLAARMYLGDFDYDTIDYEVDYWSGVLLSRSAGVGAPQEFYEFAERALLEVGDSNSGLQALLHRYPIKR